MKELINQIENNTAGLLILEKDFPVGEYNLHLQPIRLSEHTQRYFEIKDPSIVALPDGTFVLYASIGDSSTQTWKIGRFIGTHPAGPWTEVTPVSFDALSGKEVCAPAVIYDESRQRFIMHVQTGCFSDDCAIAVATSTDGQHFTCQNPKLFAREHIQDSPFPVVGTYDAGTSEVVLSEPSTNGNGATATPHLCLVFSGYRRIGCGDVYMTTRKQTDPDSHWKPVRCILRQEDVPFHNHPDYEHFEWGIEGAKIVQLADTCFLLIGVCFLPKPDGHSGTRQRVFFATAACIDGPYYPVGIPFLPQQNEWNTGEHGHPDTICLGNAVHLIYQERWGDGHPWHLRVVTYNRTHVLKYCTTVLQTIAQERERSTVIDNHPSGSRLSLRV